MSRSRTYREPQRPLRDPKPRGVVATRPEPPDESDEEAVRAKREAAKLMAQEMGELARERSSGQRRSIGAYLIDLFLGHWY